MEKTDFLHGTWYAHMTLGEVLRRDGRPDEARSAVEAAVEAAEQKGHVVRTRLARELGARLNADT